MVDNARADASWTPQQRGLFAKGSEAIRALAHRIVRTQRRGESDELIQVGMAVCTELVQAHEGGSKEAFLARLWVRARGAMIDSLRLDSLHQVRAKAMHRAVAQHLEGIEFGDALYEEEATRVSRLDNGRHLIAATVLMSLLEPTGTPEELLALKQEWQDKEEKLAKLREILGTLDPVDRQIVEGYKGEERQLKEVAAEAGLDPAQAGYRQAKALDILRKRLAAGLAPRQTAPNP